MFCYLGFPDKQVKGVAWDIEYNIRGLKDNLMNIILIEGRRKEEMGERFTKVLDPAHQFKEVTKDVRNDSIFAWFICHVLAIGKGLDQSIKAARKVGGTYFRLRETRDTKFTAHFLGPPSTPRRW